jgi:N-acetylmuramoyl-L-alanine amidase
MLVAIDEGHAVSEIPKTDHGAVGPKGSNEGDNTYVIGAKVIHYLHMVGIKTLETGGKSGIGIKGTVNQRLKARTDAINRANCDICVSIHNNSEPTGKAQYISVWVQSLKGKAEILAECINDQLKTIPWPNAGIKVKNLHMNRETKCPSCVVETGFISNPYEEGRLQDEDMRDRLAQCIARGINTYKREMRLS